MKSNQNKNDDSIDIIAKNIKIKKILLGVWFGILAALLIAVFILGQAGQEGEYEKIEGIIMIVWAVLVVIGGIAALVINKFMPTPDTALFQTDVENLPQYDFDYQSVTEPKAEFDCLKYLLDEKGHFKGEPEPSKIEFTDYGVEHLGQITQYIDIVMTLEAEDSGEEFSLVMSFSTEQGGFEIKLDKDLIYYIKHFKIEVLNDKEFNFLIEHQTKALIQLRAYGSILGVEKNKKSKDAV